MRVRALASRWYLRRRFSSQEVCVLGIETSCDDTATGIVSSTRGVLADVRHNQWDLLRQFGGVHPHMAAEEHTRVIGHVAQEALRQAKLSLKDISGIAVTAGPGMPYSLQTGLQYAKDLVRENPHAVLLPINHLEAHATCAMINKPGLRFPFLTLLISGGHTLLFIARGLGDHCLLGESPDDALGEAMDKAAKMVGAEILPGESGGAALTRLALSIPQPTFLLPVPMAAQPDKLCEFSFSGLKTSLLRRTEGLKLEMLNNGKEITQTQRAELARAFLETAMVHVEMRLKRVLTWARIFEPKIYDVVICGGCAASEFITSRLRSVIVPRGFRVVIPPPKLCSDNGVMIADNGLRRLLAGCEGASLELGYHTQWPVGPRIPDMDKQIRASKTMRWKKRHLPPL